MITSESVKSYIEKMYGNDIFLALDPSDQEKLIFSAHELLKDEFKESKLSVRVVAIQVLFMLEGEEEEYAKLKRHGVKSYKVKDISVSFDGTDISPRVLNILKPSSGMVGNLI